MSDSVRFRLNGREVAAPAVGTLLDALRGPLDAREVKDGCAPQGQCGACTVLVNGAPRVSCVTPLTRVADAEVTTARGLDPDLLDRYVDAFETTGAVQCGFCTPGIFCRLAGSADRRGVTTESVHKALAAHLCRCTGWQPIVEAALLAADEAAVLAPRDPLAAAARATLENGTPQLAGREAVLGDAPFAADVAPRDARVAWTNGSGDYALGVDVGSIRRELGAVQGRHSTLPLTWPVSLPEGAWARTLQTTFVEPAYLEPDASYATPTQDATATAGNAGAFGAKRTSALREDARRLAQETNEGVLALWSREAVVRRGKKRPPLAIALRADGTGVLRVGVTPQSDDLSELLELVAAVVPEVTIEVVEIAGPPVGASHRGAVLAELLALRAAQGREPGEPVTVGSPSGARATVTFDGTALGIELDAGEPLCAVTLRSYALGAAHAAFSMVASEGLAVNEAGEPQDLTIRSFGVVSAAKTPPMSVTITPSTEPAVPAGGAVFAATLAALLAVTGATRLPAEGVLV